MKESDFRAVHSIPRIIQSMTRESRRFAGVRALIFDLDGTLIDSGLDLALAVSATVQRMGRAALNHQQIFGYVGRGAQHLIAQALGPTASEAECRAGLAYFLTYYREHMLDNTVTYPGVREGLAALAGLPMAVLTNKPVRFSQQLLEGLGLARYFRYIYGGNSFRTKKPDPAGMQTLLRDFGAAPTQAMLIGDSDVDVQTARNSGTWACGVSYGLGSAGFIDSPPDVMVDNLTELAEYLDYQPSAPHRRE
jgi:phosphoglycolate phosphatase